MAEKNKALIGMVFGKLTVGPECVERLHTHVRYECICSCSPGVVFYAKGTELRSGRTKSCGCGIKDGLTAGPKARSENAAYEHAMRQMEAEA